MKVAYHLRFYQRTDPEERNFGEVFASTLPLTGVSGYQLLGEFSGEFYVEVPDPRNAGLAVLESRLETVRAESQVEINRLQGAINNMLAIEAPSPKLYDDDIPF